MPEATSPKDNLTSADLEEKGVGGADISGGTRDMRTPEPPDPYFYNFTSLWPGTADALVWALSKDVHMISGDQLPPLPDDPGAQQVWRAEVHAALIRLGVFDAYRAQLAGSAYAVSCPWWCAGDHPKLIAGDLDSVLHLSAPLAGVAFSEKLDLHSASSWQLFAGQIEGVDLDGSVTLWPICVDSGPTGQPPEQMDVEDLECMSRCYAQAAERFAELLQLTAATHDLGSAA